MPQKIKKQIKRSMPWFMIFSLIISTVVAGLVFNFDFQILKSLDNNLSLSVAAPEAQADTATTTVTVLNAPPTISVDPAESPTSASNTPANVGESISFTVTATDDEGNSYYLAICSSDSITASTTGGPPICGDTTFCTSTLTAQGSPTNCTYNNIVDPPGETEDWFAFVCDNHTTEGACSVSGDQGTGDSGSPFYVNHQPYFSAVITSDDNKDPGGTFTVTASTTDSDTEGGSDEVYLYVCSSNSWATSTGCAVAEWCSGTSTVDNISCSFATTTPAVDGDWNYYAFVKDWHELAATSSYMGTYTVNNVAPSVSNVVLNSGNDIQLNIKGAAEIQVSATSTSVTDNNGCTDLVSATSSIYWSSATSSEDCAADDNYCYQIASTNCEQTAGTCTGSSDATASYICTTTMAYHSLPTDNATGSPATSTNWLAGIKVFDEALSGTGTTTVGVEVLTSVAIEVTETSIVYGSVQAGQDTGTTTATTTVINYGNSPMDTNLSGTDMVQIAVDFIAAPNQEYSTTTAFEWGTEGTDLPATTSSAKLLDIIANRPTSQTNVSDYVYWGIGIPVGKQSGDYEGANTFTAVLDEDGW